MAGSKVGFPWLHLFIMVSKLPSISHSGSPHACYMDMLFLGHFCSLKFNTTLRCRRLQDGRPQQPNTDSPGFTTLLKCPGVASDPFHLHTTLLAPFELGTDV